jgi:hypothetical protein
MYVRSLTVINRKFTYPSPIKNTKCFNSTVLFLNNACLNDPAKDIENLSANHTQSEITAKLLGAFLKSMNPPLRGNEGWVTAVVAKAQYVVTENPAPEKFEHFTRHCTSNKVIKSY